MGGVGGVWGSIGGISGLGRKWIGLSSQWEVTRHASNSFGCTRFCSDQLEID